MATPAKHDTKTNAIAMLDILYQDDDLVAIYKPAGLLVHRSAIDRHETVFALQLLRDQLGRHVYPVHRLDKPTSGVLLFALSPEIAAQLASQFEAQSVQKQYLAIVRGYAPREQLIDHPIRDKFDDRAHCQPDAIAAKPAQTYLQNIATADMPWPMDRYLGSRYSLVLVSPHSGRKHQIRRHLKHISHPIIGDAKYGKGHYNRFFQQQFGESRLFLHCWQLVIEHPRQRQRLHLQAGLDTYFLQVIEAMGWLADYQRIGANINKELI